MPFGSYSVHQISRCKAAWLASAIEIRFTTLVRARARILPAVSASLLLGTPDWIPPPSTPPTPVTPAYRLPAGATHDLPPRVGLSPLAAWSVMARAQPVDRLEQWLDSKEVAPMLRDLAVRSKFAGSASRTPAHLPQSESDEACRSCWGEHRPLLAPFGEWGTHAASDAFLRCSHCSAALQAKSEPGALNPRLQHRAALPWTR